MELDLLGGFDLRQAGRSILLPMAARRLVAFAAVKRRALQRAFVAASLWLDTEERQAAGNLRSSLWRLRRAAPGLVVENGPDQLRLAAGVVVDLHETVAAAREIVNMSGTADLPAATIWLGSDLLPDWYDDWLEPERNRVRQLRLHALEALSERSRGRGRFGEAVEYAQLAVAAEPLRESGQRALISAYAAEGNIGEALHQYSIFQRLVRDELGLEPSHQIKELMATCLAERSHAEESGRRPL